MSTVEISQEERDLWRFEASDECGTPSEEDERILRLLKALEATESDLERSCEETRANFSELYRMANEVVPELKKRIADAEARVKAKGKHITTLMSEALENERNFDGMKSQWQTSEAQVARLTKALETQRNLTASAHATAQAAWGGEIPSPLPGHKRASEDEMADHFAHLNCPLCRGSGHVGDCDDTAVEAVARLTAERDWLAQQMADVYSTDEDGRYVLTCPNSELRAVDHDCDKIACSQCWAEAARKAVAVEGK